MKKQKQNVRLALKKVVVAPLSEKERVAGGVEREPSRYSCMTKCWCPHPTNWTIYCCGGQGSFVCTHTP